MLTSSGEVSSGMQIQLSGWRRGRGLEIVVRAHGDLVGVGVDGEDVEGVGRGEAETLALADGEALDALVVAMTSPVVVTKLRGGGREGLALLVEVAFKKVL